MAEHVHTSMPSPKIAPSVGILLSGREQFSPYYGGALARWTFEIYNRLTKTVDAVVFGYPTTPDHVYPLTHETSNWWRYCDWVARIPRVRRYEDRMWLRALFDRLRRRDVLHIHNRPQWVSILRELGYEGSIILHLQNDHLGHWSGAMLDQLAPHLQFVVVCSSYLRDTFAPRSPAIAAKTRVVFNGVNTQLFFPQEESRRPATVFFVGRFDPEKGILELVQAFAHVIRAYPEARIAIGGSTGFGRHEPTPYVRQVQETAAAMAGNGRIEFLGYLHHDLDLPSWFQKATIFASPSIFQEPFGLVNAEALACATPVVGSNRGGIPEVLGDTGLLVDPENIEQFAGAISELLGDADRRARLGKAGYERCRKLFDWDVLAPQWEALLTEAAASCGCPGAELHSANYNLS